LSLINSNNRPSTVHQNIISNAVSKPINSESYIWKHLSSEDTIHMWGSLLYHFWGYSYFWEYQFYLEDCSLITSDTYCTDGEHNSCFILVISIYKRFIRICIPGQCALCPQSSLPYRVNWLVWTVFQNIISCTVAWWVAIKMKLSNYITTHVT
jgi:hypothetical protein